MDKEKLYESVMDCVASEVKKAINESEYDDGDEYNDEYDEDYDDYSDIILNPNYKVKAGGRFAPKGGKDKLKELGDEYDIYDLFSEDDPKLNQVFKDIKYEVDFENVDVEKRGTTKSGIDYIGLQVGGDWESPIAVFIYWDGKAYRAYVPTRGNAVNTITKSAFGNDEEADEAYCRKYLHKSAEAAYNMLIINWDACLEEFETRVSVK